jgi:hypothetical protein
MGNLTSMRDDNCFRCIIDLDGLWKKIWRYRLRFAYVEYMQFFSELHNSFYKTPPVSWYSSLAGPRPWSIDSYFEWMLTASFR